ncbi:MAG: tripartite tricarboxylate transporter substrate binding protein [Acetobacteraceae bacterium]|nr:tripartite tricarboxylate transporter substrate binding protein [Acetobacteraceae bacterium]
MSWTVSAAAQDAWPSRPVRIVIPFAAGGSSDLAARLLAPRVGAILGQQVVVENRGGGGGNIAAESVVRATDGHTLFQGNMGVMAVNPTLYRQLPFDPERDFQPVSHIMAVANILVTPAERPWRSVADLVAALRVAPETIRAGNSGPGSIGHLAVVLLDSLAGTRSVHVPYRGGGPMATDLIAGHLDFAFATTPTVLGAIQSGRLRALAVATGTRSALLPEVPTVAEAGVVGFDVNNWDSWLFPRGVPAAHVARMAEAIRQALSEPDLRAEFARRGLEPLATSPPELAAAIRAETARWAPIVRASGATPEG